MLLHAARLLARRGRETASGRHRFRGSPSRPRSPDLRHRQAGGRPGRRRIRRFRPPEPYKGKGMSTRRGIHRKEGRRSNGSMAIATKKPRVRREVCVRKAPREGVRGRPRLSVFRSAKHIYAQVIDDIAGETLAAASTPREGAARASSRPAPTRPPRPRSASSSPSAPRRRRREVVFDRGDYLYHGRVKALADAAREGGLNF